jgi:antitoxin (DNA-binding transcriptional repressor) of toxin-antitoxin stability system
MPRAKPQHRQDDDDTDDDSGRPVQRIVPAAGTTPPPTTAANSPFAAGQAAARRGRPPGVAVDPIDVDAVPIRSGVPLPPNQAARGAGNRALKLLQRMAKGDSVVLSGKHARTLVSAARKAGVKVALRKLHDDASLVAQYGAEVAGVWRLD